MLKDFWPSTSGFYCHEIKRSLEHGRSLSNFVHGNLQIVKYLT